MNNFKKGGFRGGSGNPRVRRAEQSSYDGNPRTQRAEQSSYDGHKKFGNKFGGSGRDRGGRDRGPMQLYPAVCSECHKHCEVPFRPTGDKPVYCRDCFGKQRHVPGRNSNGQDSPSTSSGPSARTPVPQPAKPQSDPALDAMKRQLEALESKVNRILELVSIKPAPVIVDAPKATREHSERSSRRMTAKKAPKGKK